MTIRDLTNKKNRGLALLSALTLVCSLALPSAAREKTIAHEFLALEGNVLPVSRSMYAFLDKLIQECATKVTARNAFSSEASEDDCKIIDAVLTEHNFVYPGKGLVQNFSDALTGSKLTSEELESILANPHNMRRKAHIKSHSTEDFHISDCDTTSFIYLAVFETLSKDASLIEVPEHNFVRIYANNKYINWETMDGCAMEDEHYVAEYKIPKDSIENGAYLARMSNENVLGYGHFLIGQIWEKRKNYRNALKEYSKAIELYEKSAAAHNNAAWALVTAPEKQLRNGNKAVALALKAVDLSRLTNFLDTLGCAYAENHQFDKAIEIEQEAYDFSKNETFKANLEAFKKRLTWIDTHPNDAILREDLITEKIVGDKLVVSIENHKGIGKTEIKRKDKIWQNNVEILFENFKGLEGLKIEAGSKKFQGSIKCPS